MRALPGSYRAVRTSPRTGGGRARPHRGGVTVRGPRTPVVDVFRPVLRWLSYLYLGLTVEGTPFIPSAGPVIITPNHQTYADPPLVAMAIRRRVDYMAWNRLFTIPVFGWLIRRLGAFPVDLDSGDPRAAREMVRRLRDGQAVMIFPEGQRSTDGRLGRFKPGAFRLAVTLGVPVLPVTVSGGHDAWPPGRWLPRPGRIRITYHRPLHPDPSLEPREAARDLAERVRTAIASRLGPPA